MSERGNFKAGDQVQLKSGGPVMTVDWLQDKPRKVVCVFFEGSEPKHITLPPGALVAAEQKSGARQTLVVEHEKPNSGCLYCPLGKFHDNRGVHECGATGEEEPNEIRGGIPPHCPLLDGPVLVRMRGCDTSYPRVPEPVGKPRRVC